MSLLLLYRPLWDAGAVTYRGAVGGAVKKRKKKKSTREYLLETLTPAKIKELVPAHARQIEEDDDLELFMLMGLI